MSWKPIHDKHSIERVRVTLNFQEPLTQKTLLELYESFEKNASKDYGLTSYNKDKQQGIEISINLVQNSQSTSSSPVFKFQKTTDSDKNNVLESLNITRRNVSFEVLNYERWEKFYAITKKLVKQTADITLKTVDISQLTLEYWDRFAFKGEILKANPALLLKNLESHLPKSVFTDGEGWHFTKGWLQASNNNKEKILVNLDCSAQEGTDNQTNEIHRLVEIYTLTAFRKTYSEKSIDNLIKDMQELHDVSKDVFAANLVNDMKKAVGL